MGIEFFCLVFPACVPLFLHVGACLFQCSLSHGCIPHLFLFETPFYCQRGVDSTLRGGGRFFNYAITFPFLSFSLKAPWNESHYHIGLLYNRSQVCAEACAIHMAIQPQNYRWREHMHRNVSRCANMHRYSQSQMEQTHRNMKKCCMSQGRCTEKSDLIAQGSKAHIVWRQCRCPGAYFKKRCQGFSNFLVGSDLEHCCRNYCVTMMSAYTA